MKEEDIFRNVLSNLEGLNCLSIYRMVSSDILTLDRNCVFLAMFVTFLKLKLSLILKLTQIFH